jgi:hypothetical protein
MPPVRIRPSVARPMQLRPRIARYTAIPAFKTHSGTRGARASGFLQTLLSKPPRSNLRAPVRLARRGASDKNLAFCGKFRSNRSASEWRVAREASTAQPGAHFPDSDFLGVCWWEGGFYRQEFPTRCRLERRLAADASRGRSSAVFVFVSIVGSQGGPRDPFTQNDARRARASALRYPIEQSVPLSRFALLPDWQRFEDERVHGNLAGYNPAFGHGCGLGSYSGRTELGRHERAWTK